MPSTSKRKRKYVSLARLMHVSFMCLLFAAETMDRCGKEREKKVPTSARVLSQPSLTLWQKTKRKKK